MAEAVELARELPKQAVSLNPAVIGILSATPAVPPFLLAEAAVVVAHHGRRPRNPRVLVPAVTP